MMPWENSQTNLGCGAFYMRPWPPVFKRTVTGAKLVTPETVIILNISGRANRAFLCVCMQCSRMKTAPPIYEVFLASKKAPQNRNKTPQIWIGSTAVL